MHTLFFSGQSSILQNAAALATACHAAEQGLRVLLIGTGAPGLLSELTQQSITSSPESIGTNLSVMELVTLDEFDKRWEFLKSEPRYGITGRVNEIQADEIPSFPAMDEIASLIVVEREALTGSYDLIIFGGTTLDSLLRGITMRDMIRWIVRLVSGLDRGPGASITSQNTAILPGNILNTLSSAGLLQDLRVALEKSHTWFNGSIGTRVRLIFPADELTTAMLRYALNGFGLYGMDVDTVIARGDTLHLDSAVQSALESRLVTHTLPITPANISEWAARGKQLYAHRSGDMGLPQQEEPTPIPPPIIERNEVRLTIPLLNSKSLDIAVASEEVIVRIGAFRRHLLVSGMERGGKLRAKIEGETLRLWVES